MRIRFCVCLTGLCALIAAQSSLACSICRCGDPTFNALGKEGVPQAGLRVAVDYDSLDKTQGSVASDNLEELTEQRMTWLAAYSVTERIALFARVPYSWRELKETGGGPAERNTSAGLADPEVYGQVRLWSSPFEVAVGERASIYAVGGVKTSWGENNFKIDGERADEHLQPGTGSTDWFGGLAGFYQLDRKSSLFASAQYRYTGRNDAGYRYGNIWLANFAYEHKFTPQFDSTLELNYRQAQRDEINNIGAVDENTGGSMLFVTPRVLFSVGGNWVLRGAVQIPVTQSGLNGEQHEGTVWNIGVTYLFAH